MIVLSKKKKSLFYYLPKINFYSTVLGKNQMNFWSELEPVRMIPAQILTYLSSKRRLHVFSLAKKAVNILGCTYISPHMPDTAQETNLSLLSYVKKEKCLEILVFAESFDHLATSLTAAFNFEYSPFKFKDLKKQTQTNFHTKRKQTPKL